MKRNLTHILYLISFILLWGCSGSSDAPDEPATDKPDDMTIRFDISLLDIPHTNRETRADEESDITYFEPANLDTEKIKTLRVIIVDGNNIVEHNRFMNYVNPVVNQEMTFKVRNREEKHLYIFGNELTKDSWDGNGYYPLNSLLPGQEFPKEDIISLTVKANDNNILFDNEVVGAEKTYIPINEYFTLDLTEGFNSGVQDALKPTNIDSDPNTLGSEINPYNFKCFITRAASKFSFRATYDAAKDLPPGSTLSIKEIQVKSIGNLEYMLPNETVYLPAKGEESSFDHNGRFITSYEVPAEADNKVISFSAKSISFSAENKAEKIFTPQLYFAETANDPVSKYQVRIVTSTTYPNTSSAEEWVSEWADLPNLDTLPRNTHVVINISLNGVNLDCEVDVVPYIGIVLKPGFGFDTLLPGDHNKPSDW